TEALSKTQGFAGLRDGLRLMRLLVEKCWDRLQPAIVEGDDLEGRAAPFVWLNDEDRGALFPTTVRSIPLATDGAVGDFGWIHFNGPKNSELRFGKAAIEADQKNAEKALATTDLKKCQEDLAALMQCQEELSQLEKALNAIMGEQAPALNNVREA